MSELVLEHGRTQGEYTKLISQIRKKIEKQMLPQECADMLDEDLAVVSEIYQWINEDPDLDNLELYKKHRDIEWEE